MCNALDVAVEPVLDFAVLGATWRALEAETAPSFFQTWTWVGCLAEERYPDPVLIQARHNERLVGLALFNRRNGLLHLAESGDPERDRPFTEHNGPLAADLAGAAAVLQAAWCIPGAKRLVLGGVPPALLEAAGGVPIRLVTREAPFLDLDALRAAGGDYLATLSSNTRYQIRRSNRFYAGNARLAMAQAGRPEDLDVLFEEIVALHDATWQRRSIPGAFATSFLQRFHRELMGRALARGELDLLRVTGEAGTVGMLYNFRHRARVYAYQSGFADTAGQPHAKPGLTCHAFAIDHALARGDQVYDFLAGDQRYKASLTQLAVPLAWAELARPWSPSGLAARLNRWRKRNRQPGTNLPAAR